MKRIFLSVLLLLIVATGANAQSMMKVRDKSMSRATFINLQLYAVVLAGDAKIAVKQVARTRTCSFEGRYSLAEHRDELNAAAQIADANDDGLIETFEVRIMKESLCNYLAR